jgi:hypothetical protein
MRRSDPITLDIDTEYTSLPLNLRLGNAFRRGESSQAKCIIDSSIHWFSLSSPSFRSHSAVEWLSFAHILSASASDAHALGLFFPCSCFAPFPTNLVPPDYCHMYHAWDDDDMLRLTFCFFFFFSPLNRKSKKVRTYATNKSE